MSVQYNVAAVRNLLKDAFTAKELWRCCQGHPDFSSILSDLGPNASLEETVDVLLECCRTRALFPELLSEIERLNPRQYERHRDKLYASDMPLEDPATNQSSSQGLSPEDSTSRREVVALCKMAEDAFVEGDYQHAHHCFDKAYQLEPHSQQALQGKVKSLIAWGDAAAQTGDFETAHHYYALARQSVPDSGIARSAEDDILTQLGTKLDVLLDGQVATRDDLHNLQQALLTDYAAREQTIVAAITEQLNQAQLSIVQTVLDAMKADQLSDAEMRPVVDAVQETLPVLQERGDSLPGQQAVAEAIGDPTLDVKHKLKITLPIIPLVLAYEGELELNTAVNLKAAWDQLVTRAEAGKKDRNLFRQILLRRRAILAIVALLGIAAMLVAGLILTGSIPLTPVPKPVMTLDVKLNGEISQGQQELPKDITFIRVEAELLRNGTPVPPGTLEYKWSFNPSDVQNQDTDWSQDNTIYYYPPAELQHQALTVEVKGSGHMWSRSIHFSIEE